MLARHIGRTGTYFGMWACARSVRAITRENKLRMVKFNQNIYFQHSHQHKKWNENTLKQRLHIYIYIYIYLFTVEFPFHLISAKRRTVYQKLITSTRRQIDNK